MKLGPNNPTEDQKNCYFACMFKTIGYVSTKQSMSRFCYYNQE